MGTTELFHKKTIEKLTNNEPITSKQRKSADEWLELLSSGELKEKPNYLKFNRIILTELLNYPDMAHEEDNVEFSYSINGKSTLKIEVKGTATKDLFAKQNRANPESPIEQLWRYMNQYATSYGIVTNYKQFILFKHSEGSRKYHIFNFESIKNNPQKLKEFVAIFSRKSIDGNFISKLKHESDIEEREITKKFYKLYHETRVMLIKEFEENSKISRDASVHFAQLYLNRLMFIFFAEDTGKLDKKIIEDRILKTLDNNPSLSSNSTEISKSIVNLFNDMDKGSDFPIEIFAYNGGLFKHQIPPEISFNDFRDDTFFKDVKKDSKLKENDFELNPEEKKIFERYKNRISPIIKNILIMASHDFNTEVNVNILGHIFEQSISDIEDLKSDKTSRRKKEGIFYTPEYITDYICRNTIIPYLSKKGVNEVPKLIKEYADNIDELETKFKSIRILDPACGSGAFLIKATDIMLEIFKAIQEFKQQEGEYDAKRGLKKKSNKKGQLVLKKWNEEAEAKEIIEHSIYGVDINEESVEITKLSLFLKMARKKRKLTTLTNNIKQGNSLIDDEIAGNLAFDWDKEFPFKFDIVIGNPPYVRQELLEKIKPYLKDNYQSYSGTADLFTYFYEKGLNVLKENGILSYISNNFNKTTASTPLREFIRLNTKIISVVDLSEINVFEGTTTYPMILILKNQSINENTFKYFKIKDEEIPSFHFQNNKDSVEIHQKLLFDENWSFKSKTQLILLSKLKRNQTITEKYGKSYRGIVTGFNEAFVISEDEKNKIISKSPKDSEIIKPFLEGKDLNKWYSMDVNKYIIFTKRGININNYPAVKEWLSQYKERLTPKNDVSQKIGRKRGNYSWFEIQDSVEYYKLFETPKVVWCNLQTTNNFSFNENEHYINAPAVIFPTNDKFLLCILNSKLIWYFLKEICVIRSGGYIEVKPQYFEQIPIPDIDETKRKYLNNQSNLMIYKNKQFYEKKQKFLTRLKDNFGLEKITKKLENFYELTFSDFFSELKKQKIIISYNEQETLEDYFIERKKELLELKEKTEKTDNEINQMVYKLYDLTEDEIKVVEESQV